MKIMLSEEEQRQCLAAFYDAIAKKMGKDIEHVKYDCRYIEVAANVFDNLRDAFYDCYPKANALEFGMYIMQIGPKVDKTLPDDTVVIQKGFLIE